MWQKQRPPDNCDASVLITQSPIAGALIASGEGTTHNITITADDGNGNTTTCTVVLTGDDDTDPVITTCPADRTSSLNGTCQITVPDLVAEAAATDNCDASVLITQSPIAGATIASGEGTTHNITITADDGNGNTTTCTVELTGDDDTNPVITTCPLDRTLPLNATCQITVPDLVAEAAATDNCDASVLITQSPIAGANIASGEGTTHNITITADDGNGNTTTCTVELTGDDDTNPVITACPLDRTLPLNATCQITVPNLVAEAAATDNCDASVLITQSPIAGATIASEKEQRTTSPSPPRIDGNGNTTTCTVELTGDDDTNPVITTCPADRTLSLKRRPARSQSPTWWQKPRPPTTVMHRY